MSEFLDLNNPMIKAMIFVQVIGFPLAFLIRAGIHAFRSRRQGDALKAISLTRSAYYVCFALTSVGFYFFKPAGILFFVAGIALLSWQFVLSRRNAKLETATAQPIKAISIKSTRLRKRRSAT